MILRTFSRIVITAALLILSGCIQMEHSLNLRSDGTASYSLKYSISEQTIIQFHAIDKLQEQLAEANGNPPPKPAIDPLIRLFLDPHQDPIRKALENFKTDGVEIKELEVRTISSRREVNLKLEISDLSKIANTTFFKNNGFNLTKDKNGNYVFYREPYINRPGEIAKVPAGDDLKQIIPLLTGFKTTIRISVPGNIVSTTAFNNAVSTASWTFDFDRDPAALTVLQHQPFRIEFSALGTQLPEIRYRGSTITDK